MNRICKIKFCGIRRLEDVAYMNEFKPDFVGFVFAQSKRQISPSTARTLQKELDSEIKRVGVFVNEPMETLLQTVQNVPLHAVQLHGDENNTYMAALKNSMTKAGLECEIWKAIRVKNADSLSQSFTIADRLLLDSFTTSAYGGSGKIANWQMIKKAHINKPFFLAGGLNAKNIIEGIQEVQPYGVDLSSGIETDGYKNKDKIAEIMKLVRNTQYTN